MENIPLVLEADQVEKKLGLDSLAGGDADLGALISQAGEIGRPRACFALCGIEGKGGDYLVIGGEKFASRILRVNLEHTGRVALFVATCGRELEQWAESFEDFLLRYLAEEICEQALRIGFQALQKKLDPVLGGKYKASMNPGSLEDWPITQQKVLFKALNEGVRTIGVELTDSCLMRPRKSLSGIRFSAETPFSNCQLCPREECQGRRAKFDRRLFEEKYSGARHGGLYPEAGSCGTGGHS